MSEWGKLDYANNEPQYLQTNHPGNSNVYLVTTSRLANATFGGGESVAHQGWVKVFQGTGFVKDITVSNVNSNLVYTNTFLTIAGSNTTSANAKMVVTGGNNVSVVVIVNGDGYSDIPTITASGSNNSTLLFSAVAGGRMGRVQSEIGRAHV